MAKKYQAIETKIHWLTWTVIAAVIVSLVSLYFIIQPSRQEVFYNSYRVVSTDAQFSKKLPEDNKFKFVDRINNEWYQLGETVTSLAAKENQVSLVLFANPNDQTSAAQIANVYVLLYGSTKTERPFAESQLYKQLSDSQLSLYHYETDVTKNSEMAKKLNETFEAELALTDAPVLVAFLNGKVVGHLFFQGDSISNDIYVFYNTLAEKTEIKKLQLK